MDSPLRPYSATFSKKHPDSIGNKTVDLDRQSTYREWWSQMSNWDRSKVGEPRTITDIAANSPNAPLLVIASKNYLLAIENDLQSALAQLNNSDLLSIFSAGGKSLNGLADHLVPYDARLQHAVGGALRSLNMRAARMAIVESRRSLPTYSVLHKKFLRLLREQPDLNRIERVPLTDDAVRQFILRGLTVNPSACHTPLLRELRDGGQACEQKRFASLFREVQEQLHGA